MLTVFVESSAACVQEHLRDFVDCEVVPLQTLPSIGDYSDIYTFKNRCMHDICFKVLTTIYVYAFYNADNFISLLFLADCKITEITDYGAIRMNILQPIKRNSVVNMR